MPQTLRPGAPDMTTGFTKKQIALITERDGGVCAWTGIDTGRLIVQHRANRGMGGRKSMNRLSNGILLDSILNGLIESHPYYQAEAIHRGIKISGFADPLEVPVQHVVHGLVYIDDEGGIRK